MELEGVVADLIEKVERRYYGKYRGFVVKNADPEHLGRLQVTVPAILGPDVVSGWAMPCAPFGGISGQGFLFIPDEGAGVWVEFEGGDLEFPIWTGTFWSKPEGESELPGPNAADGTAQKAEQHQPTRKIIKTKAGHTIQLEDRGKDEHIIIVENEHKHIIRMDKNGVEITDGVNKNTVTMSSSGIELNGTEQVCLAKLIEWLENHQHTGNMGAPTPLFPANKIELSTDKAKYLSSEVTVK